MKQFDVATFYSPVPGKAVKRSHIHAYTVWFNTAWDGCRVYRVEAPGGKAAKRAAIDMRFRDERAKEASDE